MNKYGYKLDVDGQFGTKTQAAVRDYQKNNGLAQNGMLDVDTQVCLRKPLENQADAEGKVANPDETVVTTQEGGSRGN